MRKKVEEIENKVIEAQAKVKARESMLKKDLVNTEKKFRELKAKIPNIQDPEEYSKAVKDLEETETHYAYLTANAPKVPNKAFTDEEYTAIMSDLESELTDLKNERAPELLAAVKKAAVLMTEYVKEADMITNVMDHAIYLHYGERVAAIRNHSLKTDISKVYTDDKKLMEAFCWNYFMNADVFSKCKE